MCNLLNKIIYYFFQENEIKYSDLLQTKIIIDKDIIDKDISPNKNITLV